MRGDATDEIIAVMVGNELGLPGMDEIMRVGFPEDSEDCDIPMGGDEAGTSVEAVTIPVDREAAAESLDSVEVS